LDEWFARLVGWVGWCWAVGWVVC